MKKLIYWLPYIPLLGVVLICFFPWYFMNKDSCITKGKHFFITLIIQIISYHILNKLMYT